MVKRAIHFSSHLSILIYASWAKVFTLTMLSPLYLRAPSTSACIDRSCVRVVSIIPRRASVATSSRSSLYIRICGMSQRRPHRRASILTHPSECSASWHSLVDVRVLNFPWRTSLHCQSTASIKPCAVPLYLVATPAFQSDHDATRHHSESLSAQKSTSRSCNPSCNKGAGQVCLILCKVLYESLAMCVKSDTPSTPS